VVRIGNEKIKGNEGDLLVKKVSSDGLCVGDEQFNFDEVFDANSNQVMDTELSLDSFCVLLCFKSSMILHDF